MHMGIIVNVLLQGRMPLSGGFFAMKKHIIPLLEHLDFSPKMQIGCYVNKVETVKKITM